MLSKRLFMFSDTDVFNNIECFGGNLLVSTSLKRLIHNIVNRKSDTIRVKTSINEILCLQILQYNDPLHAQKIILKSLN